MPTRSLIAFTGGLDSTYVLHEELKKGHAVEVAYIYVTQGEGQILAELSSRRRIISHFKNLFPGQIKNEWIVLNQGLRVMQGKCGPERFQLVQQYNSMNGLIQIILQAGSGVNYRPMTGWHHLDVMENNPGELQSEETYTLYKRIFKDLVRSVDVDRSIFCNLTTPAWDMSKQDMWDSLDTWTQANISLGYRFNQEESRNGVVTLIDSSVKKRQEYSWMGISAGACTMTHFDLLQPIDRYFIGYHAGGSDGYVNLFDRCKQYYTDLPHCSYETFDLEMIDNVLTRKRALKKTLDKIAAIGDAPKPDLQLVSNS
ncbi:hypothetical protein pEaSNUABM37_00032 [Erwinia phage pEa_SNUABM_37]|nr:hypothetical protein pEaSNUABM37_00032 [Erwinia phage pEa_SNUABM_37]QXO10502.1 hypothetical protein pEaSNUABM48_00032 [Erwinia phage pEa_SNUABM_48]